MRINVTTNFSGVIESILKGSGDNIKRGEILISVKTESSCPDYSTSPATGVVISIDREVGETVAYGDFIAIIDDGIDTLNLSEEYGPAAQRTSKGEWERIYPTIQRHCESYCKIILNTLFAEHRDPEVHRALALAEAITLRGLYPEARTDPPDTLTMEMELLSILAGRADPADCDKRNMEIAEALESMPSLPNLLNERIHAKPEGFQDPNSELIKELTSLLIEVCRTLLPALSANPDGADAMKRFAHSQQGKNTGIVARARIDEFQKYAREKLTENPNATPLSLAAEYKKTHRGVPVTEETLCTYLKPNYGFVTPDRK